MTRSVLRSVILLLVSAPAAALAAGSLRVTPNEVALQGNYARAQLVVTQTGADGEVSPRSADLTHGAKYVSSNPQIATVDGTGRLLAVGNGSAEITVRADAGTATIPVTVSGVVPEPQVEFVRHVSPILSKAGCNMGACHASQYGKGGFKLSVFGFEPAADREAIVRDRWQRRVNLLAPEESLLLQKPTMRVPHGGGQRLVAESTDYRILAEWIRGGAPAPVKQPAEVTGIEVWPKRRIGRKEMVQQLRVAATYADGSTADVTAWAKYDSMDEGILSVDADGKVTAVGRGQTSVMVRFEGQAEIAQFVVPYREGLELADWTSNNFVDELAAEKFRQLGIEPSPLCDDATFVRRAFLDLTGTIPAVDEAQAFVDSTDPDKRNQLIDRLLGLTGDPELDVHNDQYAAYWTLKWSDLLRNKTVGNNAEQGMWALHNWLKDAFRTNKPFDEFVTELVTAKGSVYSNGPANYFEINRNATDLAESTAQLFLGVRMQCAKCHHHPFEKYSQDDYYGFAAFFARVGSKNSQEFGLFGREKVVLVKPTGEVSNPRTRKRMPPTTLDGTEADHPLDRRIALAEWLTSPGNDDFAKSVVNRYVSYLLGRGLVEPVDDMRATNPPTNPELMDALARHFVDSGFDVKQLLRTIARSRLYQLSSEPTAANASDEKFYSHFLVKRIPAEPLLDAIDRVTEVRTKFQNLPQGTRAIELPDAEYPNYFLTTFGKPRRASVCECERMPDPNLAQALHTLNGTTVTSKIASGQGRIARLLKAKAAHEEIVEELYLAALARRPNEREQQAAQRFLEESPSPKECYEDLLWALLNSKQFLFVR